MLRPRHAIVLCFAATTGVLVSLGATPTALGEETSAADCVQFQLTSAESDVTYSIENSCARPVGCTMSWRLVCGEEKGRTVTTSRRRFRVEGAATNDVSISTSACGTKAWSVEGVTWVCGK